MRSRSVPLLPVLWYAWRRSIDQMLLSYLNHSMHAFVLCLACPLSASRLVPDLTQVVGIVDRLFVVSLCLSVLVLALLGCYECPLPPDPVSLDTQYLRGRRDPR